jgi:hypothetical protein
MLEHYKVRSIRNKKSDSITKPLACSLDAILKFDGINSPCCVYNELVALRLAQTIHIPVATGVLTITGAGEAYASIELSSPGLRLADLLESQYAEAAAQYPEKAAALLVFDIFIGNWDRYSNLKVIFVTPHLRLFQAFDHEHALLFVENDPMKSIEALGGMNLLVDPHPFYGKFQRTPLLKWAERIMEIDDVMIHECCELGRPLGTVTTDMQKSLANALCQRKNNLEQIIKENDDLICARK